MRQWIEQRYLFWTVVLVCLVFSSSQIARGTEVNRNISFYVPVNFSISEKLEDVRLWIEGEGTKFAPMPRVFLFTYYADKKKVLPQYITIRVRDENGCGGMGLDTKFVLTVDGTYSGRQTVKISRGTIERKLKLRERDVRLPVRLVRLGCENVEDEETKQVPATRLTVSPEAQVTGESVVAKSP